MATIAKFLESGSDLCDLNDGSTAELLEYYPNSPAPLGDGRYDLVTPLADVMKVSMRGATRDAVANAVSLLEEKCYRLNLNSSNYYEVTWRANNLTTQAKATLYAANVVRIGGILPDIANVYRQPIELHFTRAPVWLGALTTITLDASTPGTIDNDDTCYVVMPALLGDLPAATKLVIASSGGNTANAKRITAGLKVWNATNFSHILQVESATFLNAALANESSTNYSPGSAGVTAKSWNPSSGNISFRSLIRWDITSNLESYRGAFLLLLRVADMATVPNYLFRARGGDIAGSNYVAGAWGTAERIATPVVIGAPTTEFTLVSLGLIQLPRYSGRNLPSDGVFIEIYGEAIAASAGKVILDNAFLIPLAMGGISAELDLALSEGDVVLDTREGFNRAYLEDSGDFLAAAANVPQGSGIYLYPRVAGQKVFFVITRSEAEYFKHDRTNVLTVTASYVPRYVSMAGTN